MSGLMKWGDGSFRCEPLKTGIYIYRVYTILLDGTLVDQSENLTILKYKEYEKESKSFYTDFRINRNF